MIDPKYQHIIDFHINKYSGGDVPEQVLRSKAKLIYEDTARQYDPSKGDFGALLGKNLMGLNRFVSGSMQVRMPEHKQQQVRMVMDAIHDEYADDDSAIDFQHMSKLLNIKPKSLRSIYAGATRSIVSDPIMEEYAQVDKPVGSADIERVYLTLPSQLHKDIFDYAMGTHGKTALKTNAEIGRKLGISESYVRKIKDGIVKGLK